MKRIALTVLVLGAGAAAGYHYYPNEFKLAVDAASGAASWVWENIRANPVPVSLAVGTFLLTVVYHKAKGKSLRESVEVAATRVTVVPVSFGDSNVDEHPVVKRAKARAMRSQLLTDQNGLINRQRKLPEELMKAEKDACYTEQAVTDAAKKLADRQKHHQEAVTRLESLRKEKAQSDAELAEIEVELKRLAEIG